ncbi:MAG TPA: hypothetical protein VGD74_11465 [Vulgatibacter sp.]
MRIKASTATVYLGGGRRWLSLHAACRAEARKVIRSIVCDCSPQDAEETGYVCVYHAGDDRAMAAAARLAKRYRRQFERQREVPHASP